MAGISAFSIVSSTQIDATRAWEQDVWSDGGSTVTHMKLGFGYNIPFFPLIRNVDYKSCTFTFVGTKNSGNLTPGTYNFNAIVGVTWYEFIKSAYNTDNVFTFDEDFNVLCRNSKIAVTKDSKITERMTISIA